MKYGNVGAYWPVNNPNATYPEASILHNAPPANNPGLSDEAQQALLQVQQALPQARQAKQAQQAKQDANLNFWLWVGGGLVVGGLVGVAVFS